MPQSTADTILGVMLGTLLGLAVWALRRQVTSNDKTRTALAALATANRAEIADQAGQFREALDAQASTFREALDGLTRMFSDQMQKVAINLAELNTGASAGARAAITDLRAELRQGLRDVSRDLGQLRNEHDNLSERHASQNGSVVQLAERVNGTRELLFEVRRDLAAASAAALRSSAPSGGTR